MSSTEAGAWDGYPPNPEVDGDHWIYQGDVRMHAYWVATSREWQQGGIACGGTISPKQMASSIFKPRLRYGGKCYSDADIQLAQREAVEACAALCENEALTWYKVGGRDERSVLNRAAVACRAIADTLPAPDLDALEAKHLLERQADRAAVRRMIVPRVKQAIAEGYDVEKAILETHIGDDALDAKLKEARRETWQMAIETLSKPLTVLGPITGHNGIQRVREACISALRAAAEREAS